MLFGDRVIASEEVRIVKNKKTILGKVIAIFIYVILTLGIIGCGVGIYACYYNNIYYSEGDYANSMMFTDKVDNIIYNSYSQGRVYYSIYDDEGVDTGLYDLDEIVNLVNVNLQAYNLNYKIYLDDKLCYSHFNGNDESSIDFNYVIVEHWDVTEEPRYIEVYYSLNNTKESYDYFATDSNLYYGLFAWRYNFIYLLIAFCILLIVDVTYLCIMVGRDNTTDDEVKLNEIDKIPFELYVGILVGVLFLVYVVGSRIYYYGIIGVTMAGLYLTLVLLAGLSVLLTFVNRIKCGCFCKNTIIYLLYKLISQILIIVFNLTRDIIGAVPLIWKSLIFIIIFIWILPLELHYSNYFIYYLLALSAIVLYYSIHLAKIKERTAKIAAGDFEHQLNMKVMSPELKDYANKLDSINKGLSLALDEKMRSERLKTELITNVSHDIKTPLTSIINYVDLLKRDSNPQQKQEYLAILDKQSRRLKKLTEDIVEFSKVSTGNIKVNKEINHGNELLKQAIGEYEEILENNNLELVCHYASNDAEILTDGKLVWRILDNCLNNIVKYSKKSTRVYVDSEIVSDQLVITMKNVSDNMLNISPEALLERFVQGDSSRSTEGSGLGLSIASDLANLLGGKFEIEIDGDLFKIIFSLPLANQLTIKE